MCGHFGCLGLGISLEDLKIVRDLGIVSQLRGRDGAGVYEVALRSNIKYERFQKTGEDFCSLLYHNEDKKTKLKILDSAQPDVIIGHVRAATVGHIDADNAHPFAIGNIVGAHNGTLVDSKYTKDKNTTDSEDMFIDISNRGILPVLQEMDADSAYAIVMVDKKQKKIFFVRNDKRPLYFAINYKRNVLYWASESSFLNLILQRYGIQYHYKKEDNTFGGGTFTLNEGKIWSTSIDKMRNTSPEIFTLEGTIYTKNEKGEKTFVNKEVDNNYRAPVYTRSRGTIITLPYTNSSGKGHHKMHRNSFIEKCIGCNKDLNLVEQFKIKSGSEGFFYDGQYLCEPCTEPELAKKEA